MTSAAGGQDTHFEVLKAFEVGPQVDISFQNSVHESQGRCPWGLLAGTLRHADGSRLGTNRVGFCEFRVSQEVLAYCNNWLQLGNCIPTSSDSKLRSNIHLYKSPCSWVYDPSLALSLSLSLSISLPLPLCHNNHEVAL